MARVDLQHDGAGRCVIVFQGRWTLHDTVPSVGKLALRLESDCRGGAVSFSCAGLTAWDSRFLTFCRSVLETLEGRGIAYDTSGLPDGVLRLLSLAAQVPEREGAAVSRKSPLSARMGEALHAAFAGTISVMEFIGDVTLSVLRMCIGRAVFRLSLIHISTLKLACLQVDSRFKLIKSSGGGGAEVCLVKKVLLTHTRPESPHHPARK